MGYSGYQIPITNQIIKFFGTEIEAWAFKQGVEIAAHLAGAEVVDIIEKERREQWCQEQGTATEGPL